MKRLQRHWLPAGLLGFGLLMVTSPNALAQAEWIPRLDDNRNGLIEPDEISDRARDYFERFGPPYGLHLNRAHPVEDYEEAARRYYARRDRTDDGPTMRTNPGPRGFEPAPTQTLIPGFGIEDVRFPYTMADLKEAEDVLDRYDRDDDGLLGPEEIERVRWRGRDPYEFDFNADGRFSKVELAQRYARRRITEQLSRMSLGVSESDSRNESDRDYDNRRRYSRSSRAGQSRGGDRGSQSLAQSLLERFDFNRNALLDSNELDSVGLSMARVDFDRDGRADRDELSRFLFEQFESEAFESAELIPTWFFERDADGDRQVLMSEFTDQWTTQQMEEFNSFDINADGIITYEEILRAKSVVGGQFANQQAQILLPRSTIVSEIEIEEDYAIGDLDVQLSITHTYTGHLDGYLIGPDGERIELFTGVGSSDDHFSQTIFDDDADRNINRARAPFQGRYQPESMAHRKPGLSRYHGKSVNGVWQLMIRGSRSDRSGILHGWSLYVKPQREQADRLQSEREPAENSQADEGESSSNEGEGEQRSSQS